MSEAVRLVIWDLDETFWKGTLTEGGITYLQKHHDIVIELARRGIMSSICSKNDFEPIKHVLQDRGIWDYFIFPSINWESKGPRLAALVEAVQLRAPTILFIDDNPMNLKEAEHFVPGLQIADEHVIAGLLDNPLCRGKDDSGLTRLAQYKLLETRHQEQATAGDNLAFLRASDIRVTIEHDLEPHLDRAIELINRTNQLNFTKNRFPENPEEARTELRKLIKNFEIQAGLVHVVDRYGDYGFIGFYVTRSFHGVTRLLHYCFSCRTLGMGVETWLFERLGRPKLQVRGDVLTDLFAPKNPIDWINQNSSATSKAGERIAGRMLVRGGCHLGSTAHYLALNAEEVVSEVNIARNGQLVRLDHSLFLHYAICGLPPGALEAFSRLGYEASDFTSALSDDFAAFDVCLFNFEVDAAYATYRHPALNARIPFLEIKGNNGANIVLNPPEQLCPENMEAVEVLRAEGYAYEIPWQNGFQERLAAILDYIPKTTLVFILLVPESARTPDGSDVRLQHYVANNRAVQQAANGRENVILLPVLDFVTQPSDRVGATHFSRMVYFRLYQKIAAILAQNQASRRTEARELEPAAAD
jgi:FkbH-like protein